MEGMIMFWYYFFKHLLGFVSICLGHKVVGMVHGADD